MNKSIFSIADVVAVLTAFAFSYVCFLGANFYTLGDKWDSALKAGLIFLILAGFSLLAKRFKQVHHNFRSSQISEIICLLLFVFTLIYSTIFWFSHSFTIFEKKDIIQEKLHNNITQAQNMFKDYEDYANNRIGTYRESLKSIARGRPTNPGVFFDAGFEGDVPVSSQIENKVQVMTIDLFPENYSDTTAGNGIKEVANDWLSRAESKIDPWKSIGIVAVVNEIEDRSISWRDNLVDYTDIIEEGEDSTRVENFKYELSFEEVQEKFNTRGFPSPISIGLALCAGVLMLLSWMITKRSSKFFKGGLASYEIDL